MRRRRRGTLVVRAPKTFTTIAIDPPWPERGGGQIKRGADKHYPLLTVPKIPEVILNSGVFRPAEDAHLYLWTTGNHLMKANSVIDALGFRYVTCVPWVKTTGNAGLGQYFRGKAEYLLFAVRGKGFNARTEDRFVVGLIEAARQEHSRKPDEAYELIEKRSRGPYLEMFARREEPRPGWTHWGNEADGLRANAP